MQFPKSNKKLIIIFFLILILPSHALGENNNSALICSSSVTAENEEELSFVIFDLSQHQENILNKFEDIKNLNAELNQAIDEATEYFQNSSSDSDGTLWIDGLHLKNDQICRAGKKE